MAELASSTAAEGLDPSGDDATPTLVVKRFLDLLCLEKVDEAVDLLAVDVEYENVGLPIIHGRERVRRLFRPAMRRAGTGFEAYVHTISADGPSVLTERTDVLTVRRLRVQLWVCGRFDVHDGQIVLWRDYFDYANLTAALLRGSLGALVPSLRAKPPVMA